ncbi:uncharacterized protein LOC132603030 [Lycium barbarum]|uniref:uncharacterized protein LOC132603030 n=1 Tax=Lycium barbarum TaxID=112863 RepID=UPI00293E4CA9|nr:uncharacterized protein LOC132603030 [Lycium barbarum]
MIHDSCPEVRLSTVNAVIYLLGNPHSHDILKVLLPRMGHLINDISPPVRAAVVDLLLALTDLRKFQFRVDEEGTNSIGGYDKEHFINPSDEGNDESDDIQNVDSIMFPKPSLKRRGSIDDTETSNQVKKNKAKSGAASIREDIHSLVEFMSSKSTATSPSVDDPVIDKCMNMLANFSDIPAGCGKYNYVCNMFLKKDVRQLFLKMETDEARKSWLEYNYQLHLQKMG